MGCQRRGKEIIVLTVLPSNPNVTTQELTDGALDLLDVMQVKLSSL